jgi:glyoxylase-like metal-dependent hydrolase (beta-lactamase superfamily II)
MTGGPHRAVPGPPVALHHFVLGYEPIPEWMSIVGGARDRYLLEPVTAAAIEYGEGRWVLLDTGFNVATVRDPTARAAHFNYDSYTAVVPPGDPLLDQTAERGLDWSLLAGAAISHLHLDHSGGLRHLSGGPPVFVQRTEWQFATGAAGLAHTYFRDDYLEPDLDIRLLDGDTVLAAGLTALDTRGHTPGHQSFRIDLGDRCIVLACDAADLRRNITEARACGTTVAPELIPAAERAIARLHALDVTAGCEVWPGHDPDWWAWQRPGTVHRGA